MCFFFLFSFAVSFLFCRQRKERKIRETEQGESDSVSGSSDQSSKVLKTRSWMVHRWQRCTRNRTLKLLRKTSALSFQCIVFRALWRCKRIHPPCSELQMRLRERGLARRRKYFPFSRIRKLRFFFLVCFPFAFSKGNFVNPVSSVSRTSKTGSARRDPDRPCTKAGLIYILNSAGIQYCDRWFIQPFTWSTAVQAIKGLTPVRETFEGVRAPV